MSISQQACRVEESSPMGSENLSIHPSCVINGDVEIGPGSSLGAFCVVTGPVRIGANVTIGAGTIVGGAPEHKEKSKHGRLIIGDETTIKEHCVIHHGTGKRDTTIGKRCYIMNGSYIAHDCMVEDDSVLSAHCCLAGEVTVQRGANLGLHVTVHQYSTIGAYAMIGMSTPVSRDVPPFCLSYGNPIEVKRVNDYQIARLGIPPTSLYLATKTLYYSEDDELVVEQFRNFLAISKRKVAIGIKLIGTSTPTKPR